MKAITRTFDFAYYQLEKYAIPIALNDIDNGKITSTSTEVYIEKAKLISKALLEKGIKKGDKIAIISTNNRSEWNILDVAISQIGAVSVPIYPTISEEEMIYIFEHSECKICFISDADLFQKIDAIQNLKFNDEIYSFDEVEGCKNWKELLEIGRNSKLDEELSKSLNSVSTKDLATIIYTSGTTGKPKGVMLSHENLVSDVLGCVDIVPKHFFASAKALSFLPICHALERIMVYIYQYSGIGIYYSDSMENLSKNMNLVKPQITTVVPRVLEKIYDKIMEQGNGLGMLQKAIFFWAVDLAERYEPYGKNGFLYEKALKVVNKLVLKKFKKAMGGNLEIVVSGGAKLQDRLVRFFSASKMTVLEGYGLTETSPVIAVNDWRKGGTKIGTVGKPLQSVEVKIAEDGEILCEGPIVMMGYYKDEEKTKTITQNGFLHTEDIGELDAEGFLKITDRKKEMFKTSGGKYIAPQIIENELRKSRFIEQIMVIGEGQKMPAALIQLDFEFTKDWAKKKGIELGNSKEEIIQNEKLKQRIQKTLETLNPHLGKWEQIKKFELVPDVWAIESGELTPTLKLKRKPILKKYQSLVDKIYQ